MQMFLVHSSISRIPLLQQMFGSWLELLANSFSLVMFPSYATISPCGQASNSFLHGWRMMRSNHWPATGNGWEAGTAWYSCRGEFWTWCTHCTMLKCAATFNGFTLLLQSVAKCNWWCMIVFFNALSAGHKAIRIIQLTAIANVLEAIVITYYTGKVK